MVVSLVSTLNPWHEGRRSVARFAGVVRYDRFFTVKKSFRFFKKKFIKGVSFFLVNLVNGDGNLRESLKDQINQKMLVK